MQKYLTNLALIHVGQFCKEYNIDQSNTYIKKHKRGQVYDLINQETQKPIITVTFHTNQVPTFSIHNT